MARGAEQALLEAYGLGSGFSIETLSSRKRKSQLFRPDGDHPSRPMDRDEDCRAFNIWRGTARVLPLRQAGNRRYDDS